MPHPFLGIGFTSPLFSKFDREETEALLELTTKSDTYFYQMNITSTESTWNYQIDWGDGNIEDFDESTFSPGHGYSSPGVHEIKIYPVAPTNHLFFSPMYGENEKITMVDGLGSPYWTSMANAFAYHYEITSVSSSLNTSNAEVWYGSFFQCTNLTPFPLLDTSSAKNMDYCWYENSSLTSFPLIDTSNVTTMKYAWTLCSGLTSFPLIDTSSVRNGSTSEPWGTDEAFYVTWMNCTGLTSFPVIDVSSATKLDATWYGCTGLTSFPLIDTSTINNFKQAWYNCSGLTSFPLINTTSGNIFLLTWHGCSGLTSFPNLKTVNSTPFSAATSFNGCWQGCTNLADFPSGLFDGCNSLNFYQAWNDCPSLTADSIENILMDINGANTSNGLLGLGGTTPGESTWTPVAQFAKGELVSRGWTIDSNS